MRVGNSGCQEELKVVIPGDTLVTEAECAGLVNLFKENGFKGRVELFADVLD